MTETLAQIRTIAKVISNVCENVQKDGTIIDDNRCDGKERIVVNRYVIRRTDNIGTVLIDTRLDDHIVEPSSRK